MIVDEGWKRRECDIEIYINRRREIKKSLLKVVVRRDMDELNDESLFAPRNNNMKRNDSRFRDVLI